jgi:hypothetical protein
MMEFDVKDITRSVEVPLGVDDVSSGVSVIILEDGNGTRSFYYEFDDGGYAVPEYSDEEWNLFEDLISHLGW